MATDMHFNEYLDTCTEDENLIAVMGDNDDPLVFQKARDATCHKINELASAEWMRFEELAERRATDLVCECCPKRWPECGEDCDTYLAALYEQRRIVRRRN